MKGLVKLPTFHERMEEVFPKKWLDWGMNWKRINNHVDFVPVEADPAYGLQVGFTGNNIILYAHSGLQKYIDGEIYFVTNDRESTLWAIGDHTKDFLNKVASDLPSFLTMQSLVYGINNRTPSDGMYYADNGRKVSFNLHRTIWLMHCEKICLTELKYKQVYLVAYNDRYGDERQWQLWSDGSITHKNVDTSNAHDFSKAIKLSSIPKELKEMLIYMNWKSIPQQERIKFIEAACDSSGQIIVEERKKSESRRIGWMSSSSAVTTLQRIEAHGYKYYVVDTEWGVMGEDGDSGREVEIRKTLKDAKNEYSKAIKTWHKR